MANYKIKDLQQAQTLNGAVALEIQDGDSMSTFATLDQIAEFLGNTTPVVLLTKAGPIDDSYLPDMSASEIAAAYDRIVADPIHTVPVVRIPDNGGQYLVPSGYGVHADTKAVVGYYASQTYVLPSSLTLTSETFTLSRLPYTASSMEWADLLNNTALPSGYLGIDSDSTSEEISAAVEVAQAKLYRRCVDRSRCGEQECIYSCDSRCKKECWSATENNTRNRIYIFGEIHCIDHYRVRRHLFSDAYLCVRIGYSRCTRRQSRPRPRDGLRRVVADSPFAGASDGRQNGQRRLRVD